MPIVVEDMSCKFESIVENYSCDVAAGVGTQAANCEAPERTTPSSWRNHVKMGNKLPQITQTSSPRHRTWM